jgi:hypothetical protein
LPKVELTFHWAYIANRNAGIEKTKYIGSKYIA